MSSKHNSLPDALPVLHPTIQIGFYNRLVEARGETLLPALLEHVNTLAITKLDDELKKYAGDEKLKVVAQHGLRGELIYPVPYLLQGKPSLIGYYRLLLGFSQKEFYNKGPFGMFKSMEEQGVLSNKTEKLLPALCQSMIESAWILATQLPELSEELLNALTLLTLGAQLRGGYNTLLGPGGNQARF